MEETNTPTTKPYPPDMSGIGKPKYGTFVQEATAAIKTHDRATLKAVFRRFHVTWMAREQATRNPIKQADDLEDALDALGVVFGSLLDEWDEGASNGN